MSMYSSVSLRGFWETSALIGECLAVAIPVVTTSVVVSWAIISTPIAFSKVEASMGAASALEGVGSASVVANDCNTQDFR
jgi:hypothetical protein